MNEFATTIENPILTTSIPDSYAYLNALRTHENKPVCYKRIGSLKGKNGGIIDGYMLRYEEAGIEHSIQIYIDPYATENSKKAPEGLQFYHDDPAIQKLIKLAEQGNAEAQNELGYLYFNGEGVPQNDYEAFKWFQKAARQEFPESYFYLGLLYSDGKVVPQDYTEALKWYKLAAENGEAAAETKNVSSQSSRNRKKS